MVSKDWIFLYGPPGSGKSSVGKELAGALKVPFYDLDELIVALHRMRIEEIFATMGEEGFRQIESQALQAVLERPPGVVALGGGALLAEANRQRLLDYGEVICLQAPMEVLLERIAQDEHIRPLLGNHSKEKSLGEMLARRASHYASFPLQLDTTRRSLESIAWDCQILLGRFCLGGLQREYPVMVRSGGIMHLDSIFSENGLHAPIAVITDENVARVWANKAMAGLSRKGNIAQRIVLPPGEEHKSLHSLQSIWEALLGMRMERWGTIVALGGGVINDLAGFAAATYMRGVAWIAVPTTLLAMVDASLGGKTGIDLSYGKNLVGAFYAPRYVLIDPQALLTLPHEELINGMAEVIKHSVIGDEKLFELCQLGNRSLELYRDMLIKRALAVKIRVVEADPYEEGVRAVLNLGHTLGHALETLSGYSLKHGKAVSIGLAFAARLSHNMGLAQRDLVEQIEATLQKWGLPTEIPEGIPRGSILEAISFDKKRRCGKPKWVLPLRIGEVVWGVDVPERILEKLLIY